MSKVLNEKKRICRIANNCVLPELHCITGPVKRAKLTKDEIVKLVRNGRTLYEIDPEGKQPEVKLTMHNCTESPFKSEAKVAAGVDTGVGTPQASPVQNAQPDRKEFQNNKWDNKNKHNKNNNYQKQNQNTQPQEVAKNETEEALTQGDV